MACGDDVPSDGEGSSDTADPGGTAGSDTASVDSADSTGEPDTDDGGSSSTGPDVELPDPLPPLSAAPLTTEETIIPVMPEPDEKIGDPRIPDDLIANLEAGFGDVELGDGEPILDLTHDGEAPTEAGGSAQLVARIVHLADSQLTDDEAPTRVASLDDGLSSSFRAQEQYGCNTLDAATRTINKVNEDMPLDFVILGGDNIDNAQGNELEWFLGIMDGADVVHCDSAVDDDPVPGPGNDPKDPFAPVGLDVPWLWVSGNHDTLVQGNFQIETRLAAAIGDDAPGGTRDWSQPGGPVVQGTIAADERRALVDQEAILTAVAASGDGHGIDEAVIARGAAEYSYDLEGTDLRFVVFDSSAPLEGGSLGVLREADLADFLRPELDAAEADGKLVVLASHHGSSVLSTLVDGGIGAMEFQEFLGEYDNILMHLAGHTHVHRVELIEPMSGNQYWEVETSALLDYPNQMRVIEFHDQDNGEYRIELVSLDYQTEDDVQGADGRARQVLEMTTGWASNAIGMADDRNVALYLPVP